MNSDLLFLIVNLATVAILLGAAAFWYRQWRRLTNSPGWQALPAAEKTKRTRALLAAAAVTGLAGLLWLAVFVVPALA